MNVAAKRSYSNSPTYSNARRQSFKFNGKQRTIYRNCIRSLIPHCVHKALLVVAFINLAVAEQHGVTFDNQCGSGRPIITEGGSVISDGSSTYTNSSSLWAGRAFLQTGSCGSNGEGCTVVEMTLINPTSTVDISLIPPFELSVSANQLLVEQQHLQYYGGIDLQCPFEADTPHNVDNPTK
ncbi:hypothetical protein BDQ12DRAFT_717201 [Crucibulum laeve]|uniref:Uncharacterized protein n=1 Tax=Crucibulum laeve TaxID=68775 RepID=A0A5C3MF18_9AGAR|nr:hypothetical protein BDQ12DRAFT_717201 [Crucibulum laeve]